MVSNSLVSIAKIPLSFLEAIIKGKKALDHLGISKPNWEWFWSFG